MKPKWLRRDDRRFILVDGGLRFGLGLWACAFPAVLFYIASRSRPDEPVWSMPNFRPTLLLLSLSTAAISFAGGCLFGFLTLRLRGKGMK